MAGQPPQPAKAAPGGSHGRSFAPSDRFVADVAGRKLRPAYVFIGDEVFFRNRAARPCSSISSPRPARFQPVRSRPGRDQICRGARPRPHSLAHGAVSGLFHSRCEDAFTGAARTKKNSPPFEAYAKDPNPDCAAHLRRRPHQHSRRRPPHGNAGQRPLRAHPRNAGRVLRNRGAGARGRKRRRCAGSSDDGSKKQASQSTRTPRANSSTLSAPT